MTIDDRGQHRDVTIDTDEHRRGEHAEERAVRSPRPTCRRDIDEPARRVGCKQRHRTEHAERGTDRHFVDRGGHRRRDGVRSEQQQP